MQVLLEKGATCNIQDSQGTTPQHLAVKNEEATMVKMLMIHGADVNMADMEGNSPLHHAASTGNSCFVPKHVIRARER